jgi:type I restriction enzyme S subunit
LTASLKPYPEYKASASSHLGSFPSHWRVARAKVFLREIDERSKTGGEEMLSVSHKTGVSPRRLNNVSMFQAESNAGHKLCRQGDVVVNTMWAWMAAAGVAMQPGLVSPAYGVYRPRTNEFKDRYLDALLRTPNYRDEFFVRSTGITSSRLRLYPGEFLKIQLPTPPPEEQSAIVRFVSNLDHRIANYVRAKQQILALLTERLSAVLNAGLTSQSPDVVRIIAAADRVERPVIRQANRAYMPVGLYNRGRGIFHKESTKGSDLGDSSFFWIEEGDLVLSKLFAWEGAIALATENDDGCIASHRYPILRGRPDVADSAYLLAYLQTAPGELIVDRHSRGAAGRNRGLSVGSFMKEKIPLPTLATQEVIGCLVRQQQAAARHIVSQITLLQEYRTSLVTDVVTGRLDVRAAAADLRDLGATDDRESLAVDEPSGDELAVAGALE